MNDGRGIVRLRLCVQWRELRSERDECHHDVVGEGLAGAAAAPADLRAIRSC